MMTASDTAEGWYRPPDEKVRPGDIFALAPSLQALKPPLKTAGNSQTAKDGRELVEVLGDKRPLSNKVATGQQDGVFLVTGRATFGVLLSRGCEVDSGPARQLAVIRPLAGIRGDGQRTAEENQAGVIDGNAFASHFLPAVPPEMGAIFPDSYVDFRYVCTLTAPLLSHFERRVSLSRDALGHLYFAWMRHTTGHTLRQGQCPKCNETIPVFVEHPGMLVPPDDW